MIFSAASQKIGFERNSKGTLGWAFAFLAVFCVTAMIAQTTSAPASGIDGVITVGPTHGGPIRAGIPDSKPLANVSFNVENEKGVFTSFTTDDQGRFQISLAPGHYRVSRKEAQPRIGRFGPFDVDVVAGQMTTVTWTCDSGMR